MALLAVSLATPQPARAACEHFPLPPREQTRSPYYDGPGALGPLHGTLTLDCLRYAGYVTRAERRIAILEDDRGKRWQVHVGSYVGDHFGLVEAIHTDHVLIVQVVRENGQWVERLRRLPRRGD